MCENTAQRGSEKPGQPGLAAAISPRLANYTCRHEERIVVLERMGAEPR